MWNGQGGSGTWINRRMRRGNRAESVVLLAGPAKLHCGRRVQWIWRSRLTFGSAIDYTCAVLVPARRSRRAVKRETRSADLVDEPDAAPTCAAPATVNKRMANGRAIHPSKPLCSSHGKARRIVLRARIPARTGGSDERVDFVRSLVRLDSAPMLL